MLFAMISGSTELVRQGLLDLRVDFTEATLRDLDCYLQELQRWNKRVNLVGLKDVDAIVKDLLYDAFFLDSRVRGCNSLVDMGSGSGILSIPLKILNRSMKVYSVDRTLRKIQFQRHIKRSLHLNEFFPVHGRIEEIDRLGVESLVVKAFGPTEEILEKGGHHLAPGGHAFIVKGGLAVPPVCEGFDLRDQIFYTLPPGDRSYTLFIYRKG
jgi:16S rRNA (guanine527-N7)-methyltransferase